VGVCTGFDRPCLDLVAGTATHGNGAGGITAAISHIARCERSSKRGRFRLAAVTLRDDDLGDAAESFGASGPRTQGQERM